MKMLGKAQDAAGQKVDDYASLTAKLSQILAEIAEFEAKLASVKSAEKRQRDQDEGHDLDAYMAEIKQGKAAVDKQTAFKVRTKLTELRKEKATLEKLARIAKPTPMPELTPATATLKTSTSKSNSVLIGKRGNLRTVQVVKPSPVQQKLEKPAPPKAQEQRETVKEQKPQPAAENDNSVVKKRENPVPVPTHHKDKESEVKSKERDEIPRKKSKTAPQPKSTENKEQEEDEEEESSIDYETVSDPKYAVWMPPEGQTGDGRTKLNDKFGY